MRYSRLKRRRTTQRYATIVLIGVLIFLGIYIATAGTVGRLLSNVITPILVGVDKDADRLSTEEESNMYSPTETPELVVPDGDIDEAEKITESLTIDSATFYAIQMGAFSNQENAREEASAQIKAGGGGYIFEDQFYRVFAMIFQREEDASKVREQLKNQDVESKIFEMNVPGVSMDITATEQNVEIIRHSFEMWNEKLSKMESIIKEMDTDKLTVDETIVAVKQIKDDMANQLDEMEKLSTGQSSNGIISGLSGMYRHGIASLDNILEQNSNNKVELSSKMKYTYIDIVSIYKDYISEITGNS